MLSKHLSTGALALLLAGCAHTHLPGTQIVTPPGVLMADCPHPEGSAGTNGDLARWLLAYREALKLCNNDKEGLREWAERSTHPTQK